MVWYLAWSAAAAAEAKAEANFTGTSIDYKIQQRLNGQRLQLDRRKTGKALKVLKNDKLFSCLYVYWFEACIATYFFEQFRMLRRRTERARHPRSQRAA
jgi:hypothetical protein